ncbi:iron-containing redox enzyme family protein [Cupriavidus necator]
MLRYNAVEVIGIARDLQLPYKQGHVNEFVRQFRDQLSLQTHDAAGRQLPRSLLRLLLDALQSDHTESLHVLHACLNELLHRRFERMPDTVDRSPLMFELQQSIVHAQLDADLAAIPPEGLPQSPAAFEAWFETRCKSKNDSLHPLFDFLESCATTDQFRRFIEVEAGVHVSFDDVIALAQIGVRGLPKVEFFRNFEDEIGGQDPEKFHLTMFARLTDGLGIRTVRRGAMPWQALACGNYMMFLAYFRSFYPYCIGYLGHLEALTPLRFGSIARAGRRLGLDPELLAYHADHSDLDTEHAQGWLHNVILPLIRDQGEQASRDIATGVCLREYVSNRYWNAMLAELTLNPAGGNY